ncbi:MAG: LTA synthase family protein [Bacteroidales bacterium]|nr:LTA synthase family protein [Bacteroidales bacterium]
MKKYLVTLAKVLVFLIVLFEWMRVVFAFYHWQLIDVEQIPYAEVLKGFLKSLPLDVATACYVMVLPAIAMFVGVCVNKYTKFKWMRWYFYVVIAVYILIVIGEMGVYGEWRTKLNCNVLRYLKNPVEVISAASTTLTVELASMWLAFTLMFCWWYVKWIEPTDKLDDSRKSYWFSYPVGLMLSFGFLLLGIRGGFNKKPICASSGCFSNYKLANVISVNPAYNLVENMINANHLDERSDFNCMDSETAGNITRLTYKTDCDSTAYHISNIERPNIMVILLESWSADLIESLVGDPGVTPNFHELEKEGLLFTNIYASDNHTEQAQANVFSGFPGLPLTAVTNHPEKYHALPSLLKPMDSLGYYTSYYYGGELGYGNILPYLEHAGFDKIVEHKDVDAGFHSGKLGYHDTDMLPWVAKQLAGQPEPFFTAVLTQSSRSPYDYPRILGKLEWTKLESDFMNSAHYADFALKLFMETAKTQTWYDNTIFVFVADHSHVTEKNYPLESFEYHHIPLLVVGEPLQDTLRGKTFDKICNSFDFPATLLSQFGVKHDEFIWSKNVFNNCYRPFAYFEHDDGFGWKTDEGEYIYSGQYGPTNVLLPDEARDSIVEQGKAFMQHHFELFSGY